jgi:phage gpG-like protein
MALALELDLRQLGDFLRRQAEAVTSLDFARPLRTIAVAAKADMKENFASGHGPDGTSWVPLKQPRQGKRHKNSSPLPLRDTGLLMASVAAAGRGHVERIDASSLEVGTNLEYAAIHQFGGTVHKPARQRPHPQKPWVFQGPEGPIFTRKIREHDVVIPARPFIGWSAELLEQTQDILGRFLEKQLGDMA